MAPLPLGGHALETRTISMVGPYIAQKEMINHVVELKKINPLLELWVIANLVVCIQSKNSSFLCLVWKMSFNPKPRGPQLCYVKPLLGATMLV